MPHECVSCGEVFEDGADEVFDGCPDCGATKFFYVKEVTEDEVSEDPSVKERSTTSTPVESTAQTHARNRTHRPEETEEDEKSDPWSGDVDETSKTTDPKTSHSPDDSEESETTQIHGTETGTPETETGDDDIVEAESEYKKSFGGKLDGADEDGKEETDETAPEPDEKKAGQHTPEPDKLTSSGGTKFRRARPEEARRRLMEQFETIRIVEPGSYELNLMNLYEEDEKIIALQEDGRYQVSLPSTVDD
jgi:predicted  nucleic acid-binding Zn-ribbon protein